MVTYVGNSLYAHAKEGCYRCERGDSLVDFDVQIEGEGALVLCKGCIGEAAEAAGLTFNRAQIRALEAEILELRNQLTLAQAREAAFNAAIDAARNALPEEPDLPDRCSATTKAGEPCKGTPLPGTYRCVSHTEATS